AWSSIPLTALLSGSTVAPDFRLETFDLGLGSAMARFDLSGKSAVVTGGGSGIGRETVLALSEQGAAVVVADFNEKNGAAVIKQGGGSIVNMASVAGIVPVKERFGYCATKGAVISMTKALAIDHVGDKIRCNCVCPGTVHTPLVEGYIEKYYEPQGKKREDVL